MRPRATTRSPRRSPALFTRGALLLCWAALVVVPLPVREVMPPDESRFAHQAQVMRETGEWIVPHIGEVPVIDKPPVLFWGMNLAAIFSDRISETTARVPSAVAALVVLLLAARLGRRLWGSEVVAFGGALLALTGVEMFQKCEWASCDMPMAAFAWIALTAWGEALFGDPVPSRPALRILAGWAAIGLGFLTKGPVTLVWALLWVVAEAVARRRFRPLLALATNPGPVLAVGIASTWLVAVGVRAGPDLVWNAIYNQSVNRYLAAWNSVQPWWFYAYQTPADLLPWTAFLPLAAVAVLRGGVAERAVACFAVLGVLFFSGSSGKRGVYVMPSFPALGLLTAAAFVRAGEAGAPCAAWRTGGLGAVAGLGLLLGVALPAAYATGAVDLPGELVRAAGPLGTAALVVAGIALASGAVAAVALVARGRREGALAALLSGALVTFVLAGTVGGRTWSRMQNARPFCAHLDAVVPKDARLVVDFAKFEQVLFYTGRRGISAKLDEEFVEAVSRRGFSFVVMPRERYDRLRGAPPFAGLEVLHEEKINRVSWVVLGVRA